MSAAANLRIFRARGWCVVIVYIEGSGNSAAGELNQDGLWIYVTEMLGRIVIGMKSEHNQQCSFSSNRVDRILARWNGYFVRFQRNPAVQFYGLQLFKNGPDFLGSIYRCSSVKPGRAGHRVLAMAARLDDGHGELFKCFIERRKRKKMQVSSEIPADAALF